jgi:peroxiredoxin/tetratricopeptide (TPR) repeat protein
MTRYLLGIACASVLAVPVLAQQIDGKAAQTDAQQNSIERSKERHLAGHSQFGEAYDEGPREKPSKMTGIGSTHFPITTKNPEVQLWFDQGNTLLHSFWFYEAERAFRWASKLEPENPMPYWGLVRSVGGGARARAFMKEASKRKAFASERERAYLDAWELQFAEGGQTQDGRSKFARALESLVMKYPDDIEAKALLGADKMGRDRVGTDLLMRQVLAVDPKHPGAHHYRIHNWDDEDGALALDSCRAYGDIAAGIGHALHMPGHIYAGVGMFHESAISLDSATRAEIAYMGRQMVFPYNTWNYAHNRNYLSYVQEQLGLPTEAIRGARELLAVPLDPKQNGPTGQTPYWQGLSALSRALIKYEKWDEILREGSIPWRDQLRDKIGRSYAEAMAHLGKKDREGAQQAVDDHAALKAEAEKGNSTIKRQFEVQDLELRGSLALLKGEAIEGLRLLTEAAPKELEQRGYYDDPPFYPTLMWSKIGYAYLEQQSAKLAVEAFNKALKAVPNDPFTLAGLVRAHHALGENRAAADGLARLEFVWSDAEPGNRWLRDAVSTGVKAEPVDRAPAKQRNYLKTTLSQFGPAIWEPFAAPALDVIDSSGTRLSLDQFRGKNVILVFYLGVGCPHCVKQLKDLSERAGDYTRMDTEIIAVSQDAPDVNAKSQEMAPLKMKIASDTGFANARRFKSHDDFEEMGIHSTILIDKTGRVYWAKHGGAPFDDFKFLSEQLRRMNEKTAKGPAASVTSRDK